MAKKILSILCALAMMVTMVSVAAFSASAAEPVAMGNITSENWEKYAAATSGAHTTSGYYNIATAGHSIWAMGQTTNVKITSTIGTYNISDAYTLAFDMFYRSENNKVDRTVYTVTVGDLVLTFGDNNHNLPFSATYNGTAVSFDKETMLNWDHYTNTTQATIKSELLGAGVASNWITVPDSGSATYYPNKLIGVEIKLEDGNLTVRSTHKGNTTFTADLTEAGYDKTVDLGQTEVKLAVEINKGDTGTLISGLGNFSGTYAAASTGGEGGETPDPEVPTTGTFAGLSDMTLYKDEAGDYNNTSGWYVKVGSGLYNSTYFDSEVLLADQGLVSLSSDEYAIGDEFSITYCVHRRMYDGGNGTGRDGSVAPGFLSRVTLGDLVVEFTSNNSPYISCTVKYDGTQVGETVTNESWGRWTDVATGSEDIATIYSEMTTAFPDGSYEANSRILVEFNISYSNGTLTVSYGKVGTPASQMTLSATIDNADFSAAALELALAERYNKGVGLYDFAGTYTPYVAPAVDPLAPGKFLSINDSLAINFAYAEGALADYTDVEVNASIGGKGETLTPVKKTLTDGVYDVYVVDFLTPDLFGTDVEFSITAKKGGADVSYETTYSVKDYCVNMMNASGSSNELKSLCAAILEYGEAARLWKLDEGKTAPATSITDGLTYTAPTKWTVGGKTSTFGLSGEPTNVVAEWGEFNLNLADNVGANLEVIIDAGESIDNYYASVDGINVVGGDLESLVSLGNNKYKAVIRVYAYEMANDFTVKVREVGTNEDVSYTFTTGVQNYILKGIETGVFVEGATDYNCAVALLTYGAAAAAYNS